MTGTGTSLDYLHTYEANSSSAGAGTIFATGIYRSRQAPRTQPPGIPGRPGFGTELKILKKYKSRDESRDLYFSEARSVWKRAAIAERAV